MEVATWNILGWKNNNSLIFQLLLADHTVVGLADIRSIALIGNINGNGPKEKRIKFSSSVKYPRIQLKSL